MGRERGEKSLLPEEIESVRAVLRSWRAREGLERQVDVAERLGVKQATISNYLRKDGFGAPFLRSLADATHTLIDVLIGRRYAPLDIAVAYHGSDKIAAAAIRAAAEEIDRGARKTPPQWWLYLRDWKSVDQPGEEPPDITDSLRGETLSRTRPIEVTPSATRPARVSKARRKG